MNYKYEKLNYSKFNDRLSSALKNEKLKELGIRKNVLGTTKYGYEVDEYVLGNGPKDLFIVGGTHGSEIIGVDFVTQLLNNVDSLEDYDQNLVTLHFIPNQNPEGFDITTQTIRGIDDSKFKNESYDYYLRYRTDNLLNNYLNKLNIKFNNLNKVITPEVYLDTIVNSFNEDAWINLTEPKRGIPELSCFPRIINDIKGNNKVFNNFEELQEEILTKNYNEIHNLQHNNPYFDVALDRISISLFSDELLGLINQKNIVEINKMVGSRLYQEKFENMEIDGTQSKKLGEDIKNAFEDNKIPKGSQVKFDPTGEFVNLNKNRPDNPGIQAIADKIIKSGPSPANNIIDNAIGPIGMPSADPKNFNFAIENAFLLNLLEESSKKGRLAGVLLYHGTGGLVYSKPYDTGSASFNSISKYNDELSDSYKAKTNYRQIENADNTGFGDLLRQKYPGVLLIELSRVGGNPIAPYGDLNNYDNIMLENMNAVNNVIKKINDIQYKEENGFKR